MTNIVIGIDGSETSAHALRWATREGQLRQEGITAVLAWGLLDQHHPDHSSTFNPNYGVKDAQTALHSYVTAAVGAEAAEDIVLAAMNDLPHRALIDASGDASLLVLGGRGLGGFKGMLLGAVSYHCLHYAACPIAVVREPSSTLSAGPEKVVVGIDGSESAHRALLWAVDEARFRGASLEIVHSWNVYYGGGGAYGMSVVDPNVFEEPAQKLLDACLDGVDVTGLVQPPQRTLVCDSPAHALLTASAGADLLVAGSRGIGGFPGLLVGSTTNQVVHHADCPVVVIPTER
jgi:nucleotide-binding universal stress UspA family protein